MDEEKKDETVLDDLEEAAVEEETKPLQEAEEVAFGDFSNQVKYDVEIVEADKGKVFEIETVEMKTPIMTDASGQPTKPIVLSPNDPTKIGYTTKLVLTFKGTNYAAIVPSIKWYKSTQTIDNKLKTFYNPWFNTNIKEAQLGDNLVSEISKLFFRYCKTQQLDMKKVTQKQFVDGLKGQKVKLETKTGTYKNKDWAKITVTEFVK